MHRNTYLLLVILAVAAAVVVGVNVTKSPEPPPPPTASLPTPVIPPPSEPAKAITYTLAGCGIAFPTPADHAAIAGPGNSVVFTAKVGDPARQGLALPDTILVTCQKEIPRPPLPPDKIEKLTFELPDKPGATFSANLYHDASAIDDAPVDKLIFKHSTKDLDIFISGFGETFQTLIRNLTLLP